MKTFNDIVSSVKSILKLQDTDISNIKKWVNTAYQDFNNRYQWDWRLRTGAFQIIPLYTTGTVNVVQDSRTVTGNGTAFTSAMVDRYFRISDDSENYYKIVSVTSTTELILDNPFIDDTATLQDYEIWKRYYSFIPDVKEMCEIRTNNYSNNIKYYDFLDCPFGLGTPSRYKKAENDTNITEVNFSSSLTLNKDSNIITGSGTTFITDVKIGDKLYINTIEDLTKEYNVLKIISNTQLYTVQKALEQAISTSGYIKRTNLLQLEFDGVPDTTVNCMYKYFKQTYNMLNDNDEPEIPEEYRDVIFYGTIALSMQELLRDKNVVGYDLTAKNLFENRIREILKIEFNKSDEPKAWQIGD